MLYKCVKLSTGLLHRMIWRIASWKELNDCVVGRLIIGWWINWCQLHLGGQPKLHPWFVQEDVKRGARGLIHQTSLTRIIILIKPLHLSIWAKYHSPRQTCQCWVTCRIPFHQKEQTFSQSKTAISGLQKICVPQIRTKKRVGTTYRPPPVVSLQVSRPSRTIIAICPASCKAKVFKIQALAIGSETSTDFNGGEVVGIFRKKHTWNGSIFLNIKYLMISDDM